MPDIVGALYFTLATMVARKTSSSAVTGMPWLLRTRKAYNRLEQDNRLFTCSVTVRRSLTTMPSILKLVSLSMLRHWEGSWTEVARVKLVVKISSLDLTQLSSRLFSAAHFLMCKTYSRQVFEFTVGITRYVSSAYLKMWFLAVTSCRSAYVERLPNQNVACFVRTNCYAWAYMELFMEMTIMVVA